MTDVTIAPTDATFVRVREEAERRGVSVSDLLGELVAQRFSNPCWGIGDPAAILQEFFDGPGFPGISRNLPTREELCAERDEDLARRRGERDA